MYSMVSKFSATLVFTALFFLNLLSPVVARAQESSPLTRVSSNLSQTANGEVEPSVAVNPTNPRNIAAVWFAIDPDVGSEAIVAGVTFDGGKHWRSVVIPGLTIYTGGERYDGCVNPSLSFAPNGDLYTACLRFDSETGENAITFNKSLDGGLTWSHPRNLAHTTDPNIGFDSPTITADPQDARYVYATWLTFYADGSSKTLFACSKDGGQTWQSALTLPNVIPTNGTDGNWMLVHPDGTLLLFHAEHDYSDPMADTLYSLFRSTDRGKTWSAPHPIASLPAFLVTDPDTGAPIVNQAAFAPSIARFALDPDNTHLYMVWEDNRFSGGAYSEIAFSMSDDCGRTWSSPIPINKTPHTLPPGDRQASYPTIAVLADGTIGVTYCDFRFNDANPGCSTDYWLVTCHPTARRSPTDPSNWGDEVRLTDTSFDIMQAPSGFGIGPDLGDHLALGVVGNTFLPVWAMPHYHDPCSIFFRRVQSKKGD
jgi:hypothetical protein